MGFEVTIEEDTPYVKPLIHMFCYGKKLLWNFRATDQYFGIF